MLTAKMDEALYSGAGYAVAAILDGQVIVAAYIPGATARKPTRPELAAAYQAVWADPIYKAADAVWMNPPADASDELVDALYIEVQSGMMSGGEFVYTIGLADKRRLGLVA